MFFISILVKLAVKRAIKGDAGVFTLKTSQIVYNFAQKVGAGGLLQLEITI